MKMCLLGRDKTIPQQFSVIRFHSRFLEPFSLPLPVVREIGIPLYSGNILEKKIPYCGIKRFRFSSAFAAKINKEKITAYKINRSSFQFKGNAFFT